jgi:molybdenum cofactor sulfurtransferase
VFLDTASYCSTSAIDLPESIDFCCLSFYKMFGFPTGVGALIAKTSSLDELFTKSYFAGGTVEGLNQTGWTQIRQGHEKWEDGTLPFLEILAIGHGFDYIEGCGGWKIVENSVSDVARYARIQMKELRHAGGGDVVVIYEGDYETGPIICFNVKSYDGSWIGHGEVGKLADMWRILMRTGCFCNMGFVFALIILELVKRTWESVTKM